MVRTLIATMVMTASMSVAGTCCPASNGTDASTTQVAGKAAATKDCSTPCDGSQAATMAVVNDKSAKDCASACSATAAATMAVSAPAKADGKDCASSCSAPATMAVAGEGKDKDCASACSKECATACDSGSKMASFASYIPAMSYKVGDETMTCSKMAGAKASEHNADMHFVVNGVEYADKAEATVAHTKQLQGMMMDLVRVQYAVNGECVACPDSAKKMAASCESKQLQYRVGPATFDNAEDAIKASIMAYNAAMNVSMQYAVGENTTACSVSAGEMAKAKNCSVEYVVNGQRTACPVSAEHMKTLTSVQNAIKALETASTGAATTTASTDA